MLKQKTFPSLLSAGISTVQDKAVSFFLIFFNQKHKINFKLFKTKWSWDNSRDMSFTLTKKPKIQFFLKKSSWALSCCVVTKDNKTLTVHNTLSWLSQYIHRGLCHFISSLILLKYRKTLQALCFCHFVSSLILLKDRKNPTSFVFLSLHIFSDSPQTHLLHN